MSYRRKFKENGIADDLGEPEVAKCPKCGKRMPDSIEDYVLWRCECGKLRPPVQRFAQQIGNVLLITSMEGRMVQCAFCGGKWCDNWIDVDGVEVCLGCWEEWTKDRFCCPQCGSNMRSNEGNTGGVDVMLFCTNRNCKYIMNIADYEDMKESE